MKHADYSACELVFVSRSDVVRLAQPRDGLASIFSDEKK